MILLGIIVSIILFSVIVLIHEYGHFKSARIFGVKIEEFGLGIPPRAKKLWTDKEGTLYSLNWLPLGGFVKITGESPSTFYVYDKKGKIYNNEDLEKDLKKGKKIFDKTGKEVPKSAREQIRQKLKDNGADYNLINKPYWQQSVIILAGVFMNFLLAVVIFSVLFMIGVKPIGVNDKIATNLELKLIPTLEQSFESGLLRQEKGIQLYPIENSIAKKSGIQEGDLLLKIDNVSIQEIKDVQNLISESAGEILSFYIERKQKMGCEINTTCESIEYLTVSLIPGPEGKIGSYLSENIILDENFKYKYGLLESVKYGTFETYNQSMLTFKALGILARKIFNPETEQERQDAINQISGPIGVVDFISQAMGGGIMLIFIIGAIISINLGVFNLLPIPALDGGRFIFIFINGAISKIFGKKGISANIEGIIHTLFFVLLIALSIIIAYNDISKIVNN